MLVLAESYKFSEKVQLDAIVFNELGSAAELVTLGTAVPSQQPGSGGAEANKGGGADAEEAVFVPQTAPVYRGTLEAELAQNTPTGATSATGSPTSFQVLNLRYDFTPMSSVSVVATEAGLIPPTSIPVLIRELRVDESLSSAAGAGSS